MAGSGRNYYDNGVMGVRLWHGRAKSLAFSIIAYETGAFYFADHKSDCRNGCFHQFRNGFVVQSICAVGDMRAPCIISN